MKVSVLGALDLSIDGKPTLLGLRPRRVLCALALEANRPVSVDRLVELVWSQPPPSARNSLQSHISRLRGLLGTDRLTLSPGGYVLRADVDELDVLAFERDLALAGESRNVGDHSRVVDTLRRALALWRGAPFWELANHADDEAMLRIAELERLRDTAAEDLLVARLASGSHRELLPDVERMRGARPLDENLTRLHALALHRAGQHAASLDVLRDFRTTLRSELGLDASADLRVFEQQLLNRDPALDLVPPIPGPREGSRRDPEQAWTRAGPLPPTTQELLHAAALSGRDLDVSQLSRATKQGRSEVVALLEPAVEHGVITVDPRGLSWSFVDERVREALAAELDTPRRLRWHQRLGDALTAGVRLLDEATLLRAAHHLSLAAVLDPQTAERASGLFREAADRAVRRGTHSDAVTYLLRALGIAAEYGDHDDAALARLQVRLAASQLHCGAFDQSAASYREAADRAHGLDLACEVEAALGFEACSVASRRHRAHAADPSLKLLNRALSGCGPDDAALRASVLGALSQTLAFCGIADQATETGQIALSDTDRLGNDRLAARVLIAQHARFDGDRELDERIAVTEKAWRAADRAGDVETSLEARRLAFPDLCRVGRIEEAEALVDTVEALADSLGSAPYRWHVPMWRATLASALGHLDEAELLITDFLAAGRHHGYPDVGRVHAIQLMLLRTWQGHPDQARDAVEAAARNDEFEPWAATRVMTDVAAGDLDRAKAGFQALAARRFRLSPPFAGIQTFTLSLLAEPCLLVGDADDARVLYDLIAPAAGRNLVLGAGAAMLGDARHHLGLLASRFTDPALAARLLADAGRTNAAWGLLPAAQRSAQALAQVQSLIDVEEP